MLKQITVRRIPGRPTKGIVQAGPLRFPCALGRGGTSAFKREGDGATPVAPALHPLWGYWRADRGPKPVSQVHFTPSRADEGWCDAPGHGAYNAPVRLPFPASHEKLQRQDRLYDIAVVLSWNMAGSGRLRNRGSAIFMRIRLVP